MLKLLAVGLGGFVGAVGRYAISGWVQRWTDSTLPYGTFAVNIIGCFLLGLVMYYLDTRSAVPPNVRLLLTIGLLGAFTTYSTFAYETMQLVWARQFLFAAANVVLHVIIGLAAVWAGSTLPRWFWR